jgi:hypothetical protein
MFHRGITDLSPAGPEQRRKEDNRTGFGSPGTKIEGFSRYSQYLCAAFTGFFQRFMGSLALPVNGRRIGERDFSCTFMRYSGSGPVKIVAFNNINPTINTKQNIVP